MGLYQARIAAGADTAGERLTVASSGVLSRGGNSFGFLRLVLAACVIASHTFSIGGFGAEPLWAFSHSTITLGSLAVWGFFGLSGLLVALSAERVRTPTYLWRRARRILPAFWVCLVVSAFGFSALIAWTRGLPVVSFTRPMNTSARSYVVGNFGLGIHQLSIGSVLHGLPYPFATNGSLWSLAYEAACYLIVLAIVRCWLAAQRRDAVIAAALTIAIFLSVVSNAGGRSLFPTRVAADVGVPFLGPLNPALLYPLFAVFMTGAAIALWRERIRLTPTLTVVAAAICVVSMPFGWFVPAGSLALPYALIGIGYYLPHRLRPIGVRSDFSYGLYLYGFPVGQALIATGPSHWRAWSLMSVTFVATFVVAVVSWYGVERFFLRSSDARVALETEEPQTTRIGPALAVAGARPLTG